MKTAKRITGILLACLLMVGLLAVSVSAAGTKEDPIDAQTKWFGYGVDTFLLNPTIAAGTTDGMWYTLTANKAGILFLEHKYKDVDYTITITVNGNTYVGGSVDGVIYNGPIMTPPLQVGDVATVQVVTKDAAAGTVYANMNIISGDDSSPIKVKSTGIDVYVGAGETVYFQDDTLNAVYATKGLLVEGDVANAIFYTVSKNTESGAVATKAVTDSDKDGKIEAKLGGSLGSAGAPPVKPAWAIENTSDKDCYYTLTVVDAAHECVYDDNTDVDCNTCGVVRELPTCEHAYDNACDTDCNLCGETRAIQHFLGHYDRQEAVDCKTPGHIEYWYCATCLKVWSDEALTNQISNSDTVLRKDHEGAYPCSTVCKTPGCGAGITSKADHTWSADCDTVCNVCTAGRTANAPHTSNNPVCKDGVCTACGAAVNAAAAHDFKSDCDTSCGTCNGFFARKAAHTPAYTCKDSACTLCENLVAATTDHAYDGADDADCNVCGDVRLVEYAIATYLSSSVSEDVNGLAFLFNVEAAGMEVTNGNEAVYTNATVAPTSLSGSYNLIGMGAVVSNQPNVELKIENDDDRTTAAVPAVFLCDLTEDAAQFAVRIIYIPDNKFDVAISARAYYIYENANGEQVEMYGETVSRSYNSVYNP